MERKFVIVTDSCSDLGKDIREKYNIDYLQMNIVVDGKELPACLNWEAYSPKELYDFMRKGIVIKTTQVPQVTYDQAFRKYLEAGYDILYIGCSSALSGSVNTSNVVKSMLLEEYKDAKIFCIDSLSSCLGEGMMAVKAAIMRQEGQTITEVADWIEENKLCFNQAATVQSLEYLKRAGRVKTASAFFGNIFGVKPIIISDAIGQNFAYKKVKGRLNSIKEIVNEIKANIIDPEKQIIFVGHADCIEEVTTLKEMILKEIPCKGVYINYIGPVIGASTGPGTLGVYFYGKKVEVKGN